MEATWELARERINDLRRGAATPTIPTRPAPAVFPTAGQEGIHALRLASVDPARVAAFWAWLLGLDVRRAGLCFVELSSPWRGGPPLRVAQSDIGGTSPLDVSIRVRDVDAAARRVLERGGQDVDAPAGAYRVMADPEGNQFRLVAA